MIAGAGFASMAWTEAQRRTWPAHGAAPLPPRLYSGHGPSSIYYDMLERAVAESNAISEAYRAGSPRLALPVQM